MSQHYVTPNDGDLGSTPLASLDTVGAVSQQQYIRWGVLCLCFLLTTLGALWQRLQSNPKPRQEGQSDAAEATRRTFYNLLLAALLLRTCMIPLLIFSYYHSRVSRALQLLSDTLPLVAFAATWAWLVNFFVRLVNTASGTLAPTTTTTDTPASEANSGISLMAALQWTAYGVYMCLIVSYFLYHEAAAVLLYALLCCIFAALMGTWVFVCPKLIGLLQPLEDFQKVLAVRLWVSCGGVFVVLLGETIALARQVLLVFPFSQRSLWMLYGGLELLPSLTLLVLMHAHHGSSDQTNETSDATNRTTLPQYRKSAGSNMRRTYSAGGTVGGSVLLPSETAPLLLQARS